MQWRLRFLHHTSSSQCAQTLNHANLACPTLSPGCFPTPSAAKISLLARRTVAASTTSPCPFLSTLTFFQFTPRASPLRSFPRARRSLNYPAPSHLPVNHIDFTFFFPLFLFLPFRSCRCEA
ncbi:hypothetical protein COCCADRAFT_99316 [Bipolaris zeicola 26-R-13]|uniref:Uncharacterized protein n=1 Tax=Cochliobolus carbonum (strain 26-R-13) TaxID=930089 RepID=W6Y2T9_COCC2|nr:uncharacterized protein COCCADRAFT_99316 [Bipolaris zeicola 26-R-13]EUC32228.1 hypothetical protein COCCADRAFT_99316 [Bipolaris zeicola 26-R-13]